MKIEPKCISIVNDYEVNTKEEVILLAKKALDKNCDFEFGKKFIPTFGNRTPFYMVTIKEYTKENK